MPYKDREVYLKYQKEWRGKNKELRRKSEKEWIRQNSDKFKATQKRYYEKVKLKRANTYMKIRLSAINFLGGECIKCGNVDERVLEFHHIGGNKLDESGKRQFLRVLDTPKDYQLLCANCHRIVTREFDWNKHLNP